MKFKLMILILAASALLAAGCSSFENPEIPEIGKYVMKGAELEDFAWVLLEENNQFQFNRHIATSYIPMGEYTVEEDELVLKANENEIYRFKIIGNTLTFISGKTAESLVEKGTVFELSINK